MIGNWRVGIPQAALVSEAEATRLLGELAAWMHQTKPAGIATEGEVKRKLAEVKAGLAGKEADDPEILQAVDDFLSKIRQHTGLFVVRAPQRYGFMHLTFEEYFAARWLVARPRQAARRIRERLHLPRWEEPILLAVGFYGMEFPDDVDHLFEEALLGENLGGPSPYEPLLHRDLLFAVRAMGDQDTGPALRRRLVREFVRVWFDPQGARQFDLLKERWANVFSALPGSAAYTEAAPHLLAALQDPDEDVRARAASALGKATDRAEVVSALLTALQNPDEDVRARAPRLWARPPMAPRSSPPCSPPSRTPIKTCAPTPSRPWVRPPTAPRSSPPCSPPSRTPMNSCAPAPPMPCTTWPSQQSQLKCQTLLSNWLAAYRCLAWTKGAPTVCGAYVIHS